MLLAPGLAPTSRWNHRDRVECLDELLLEHPRATLLSCATQGKALYGQPREDSWNCYGPDGRDGTVCLKEGFKATCMGEGEEDGMLLYWSTLGGGGSLKSE